MKSVQILFFILIGLSVKAQRVDTLVQVSNIGNIKYFMLRDTTNCDLADSMLIQLKSGKYRMIRGINTKRQEVYSGTTNASGVYTVTFPTAYAVAPNIQTSITNQSTTNQYLRVSNISTTGFTINAFVFNTNNLLGIVSLVNTVSNLIGVTVDVLITEK